MNQFSGHPLVTDREVVAGALGLGAPQGVSRHGNSHAVVFLPHRAAHRRMPIQTLHRRDAPDPPCRREHHCSVLCDKADRRSTAQSQSAWRPMAALLNRQRLDLQANGSFLYRSRRWVLRYEIRPEVGFTANWSKLNLR